MRGMPRAEESTRSHFLRVLFCDDRQFSQRLSRWLAEEAGTTPDDRFVARWLPLPPFDARSRLVILFRGWCADVGIDGDALRVFRTGEDGEHMAASFGSARELELYLRLELRREISTNKRSAK